MRAIDVVTFVVLIAGAVGCGKAGSATASTGGAGTSGSAGASGHGGAAGDGGQFCAQALDCTKPPAGAPVGHYCTLSDGIASACMPCGGDGACALVTGISYGDTYTYVTIFNVDVGTVMAYDKSGALVAVLGYSPGHTTCDAGPPDFDPTEANTTSFTASSQQALQQICAADGGQGGGG